MPKTKAQKQETVQALTARLKEAKGAVFATFAGIKAGDTLALRREAKKEGVYYTVAKKTLLGLALKSAGVEVDPHSIQGSIAFAASNTDPVSSARVLAAFAKTHHTFMLAGGILEGKVIDEAGVRALAALPGRQELLAGLVRTLNAPVSGLVQVCAGTLRSLLYVLKAAGEARHG
jgi:large subunit ribosomal protein L10